MIIGRNKNALANHFDRVAELEATLEQQGRHRASSRRCSESERPRRHPLRAPGRPARASATRCCARAMHVGDQPFAVLLGDDLIDERDPLLTPMLEVQHERNAQRSSRCIEVDPDHIHLYGAAAVEADRRRRRRADHRPRREAGAEDAPVEPRVIGRYVLQPEVFDILEHTEPGKGGEIQLTDALQELAADAEWTGGVYGVVFRGRRYDTGDRLDYIKAIVQLAADRDDLGPELRPWLKEFAATL